MPKTRLKQLRKGPTTPPKPQLARKIQKKPINAAKPSKPLPKRKTGKSAGSKPPKLSKRAKQLTREKERENEVIVNLQNAKRIYEKEEKEVWDGLKKDSESRIILDTLEKGTLHDKVRALSWLVTKHPDHSLNFLARWVIYRERSRLDKMDIVGLF